MNTLRGEEKVGKEAEAETEEEAEEEEEEAVTVGEEVEELDSSTLGVPGLRTLSTGDRVDILWSNGAHG